MSDDILRGDILREDSLFDPAISADKTRSTRRALDLAALLQSISVVDFAIEWWEQKPLYIQRQDPTFYHNLFTVGDLETILVSSPLAVPTIRLVRNNKEMPASQFVESFGADGASSRLIDVDKVISAVHTGATLVFTGIHRYWRPIDELCRQLEVQSSFDVQANCYLTPASAAGFGAHWDSHEVMVLQIEGSKEWVVYDEPDLLTPLPSYTCDPALLQLDKPHTVYQLDAGDLLYIPRGYAHRAATQKSLSLHLSIAIKPPTWADILHSAIEQGAREYSIFRRGLPFGYARDAGALAAAYEEFSEIVAGLDSYCHLQPLIDNYADHFVTSRRPLHFAKLAGEESVPEVTPTRQFRMRPDLLFRVAEEDDAVWLLSTDLTLEFSKEVAPLLHAINRSDAFSVESLPPVVDEAERLSLVQQLLAHRLLIPVSDS